jgi:transposase
MNTPEVNITSEQINDIPLLLGIMEEMGIRGHIDRQIAPHGGWEGLSAGSMIVIWLSYMLSERDHRMVAVREWVMQRAQMLNELLGIQLRETDMSDDRLARVLSKLGDESIAAQIDAAMVQAWITVYALPSETIRLDSTSVSVYSAVNEAGELIHYGHSKDHRPDLGQFKVMLSSLDPMGMPLGCAAVGGERADDGLYVPMYEQSVGILGKRNVLVVGDSKMAALGTRGHIVAGGSADLCAYRPVGNRHDMAEWVEQALQHPQDWQTITEIEASTGEIQTTALVYEWTRPQAWIAADQQDIDWTERVLVVRSEQLHQSLCQKRRDRWARLAQVLSDLRLPPARGRKRYRTRAELKQKVDEVLAHEGFTGLVKLKLVEETLPAGTTRWTVGSFALDLSAWESSLQRLGWLVYLTNTTLAQYDTPTLLWNYRHQVFIERSFSRLKTRHLYIRPLFIRDEQRIIGLTWLLCLALRVLTLTEFRLRAALQHHNQALSGLNPAVPSQATVRPTTERVIHVFQNLTLTLVHLGTTIVRHVTPLSSTQNQILALLNLPLDLYSRLVHLPPNLSLSLFES